MPHLAYSYQKYGDPFAGNTHIAKWYRNYEFLVVNKIGCSGCPTLEEFWGKNIRGDTITMFDYIFGLHSLPEVIERVFRGYFEVFLKPDKLLWHQIGIEFLPLYYLFLIGLVLILFSKYRKILLFPLLTINLIAFVIPLGIDPRLAVHNAPFIDFILTYPIWVATPFLWKYLLRFRDKHLFNRYDK
jgi:hypothetical protein